MSFGRARGAVLALVVAVCAGCEGTAVPEGLEAGASRRQDALAGEEPVRLTDLHGAQYEPWWSVGIFTREVARVGNRVFLASGDYESTRLWVAEGSTSVARLVWDFNASVAGSPSLQEGAGIWRLVGVGPLAYLVVQLSGYPTVSEVWRSDGTPEGTWPLSTPAGLAEPVLGGVGDTLYFAGQEGQGGPWALWKSQGGRGDSVRIKALPLPVTELRTVGSTLFIASGGELWKSDGTEAGTVRVAALAATQSLSSLTAAGSTLYFLGVRSSRADELWRSDGTAAGTVRVLDLMGGRVFSSPRDLVARGATLFFSAVDEAGREPWKSDGTGPGTVRVADLAPGAAGSEPSRPVVLAGQLYFLAQEGGSGRELWTSDGTAAGTVRLTDRVAGPGDSFLGDVLATEHRLFLFSRDEGGGTSLWARSGAADPVRLTSGQSFSGEVAPSASAALGDTLFFFSGAYAWSHDPWISDGVPFGMTRRVQADVAFVGSDSNLEPWADLDGTLLFTHAEGTVDNRHELWRSTGTTRGTRRVAGWFNAPLQAPARLGNRLLFAASLPGTGLELWSTDGTEAGTALVRDLVPGPVSSEPGPGVVINGRYVFPAATAALGLELWSTDGTAEGTVPLKDVWPGAFSSSPGELVRVGGLVYFTANDGVHGVELWRTDGTAEGTRLVADVVPGQGDFAPSQLRDVRGTLTFAARDPALADGTPALWRWEVATGMPRKVAATAPHPYADWAVVADGTLFYSANMHEPPPPYGQRPAEVWMYGGGTTSAMRVAQGGFFWGTGAVAVGGKVLFSAWSPGRGRELWRAEASGVRRVKAFQAGPTGGGMSPFGMVALEGLGQAMFGASDGAHGVEPWISDGTEAGTVRVGDLAPGPASSVPQHFLRSGARLFFIADDGPHGQELWTVRLSPSGDLPPQLTCPVDRVEELSARATPVTWPHATVSDEDPASVELTYTPARGSGFALGTTPVWARAVDAEDHSATCSFQVTVHDTTPPSITCPPTTFVEATSASGGRVFFSPPTAWDADAVVRLSYPPSGDLAPLGEQTHTAEAQDPSGNTSSCTYRVVVRDTTPPRLSCPPSLQSEAVSLTANPVTYAPASASDTVSAVTVTYSQASGSLFSLGTTPVEVTARDAAGNTGTCSFFVWVRDTKAPVLVCGKAAVTEATSPEGALVTYDPGSASDNLSAVTVTYSQASGTRFALGTTWVTMSARDASSNTAACGFAVTVRDSTPPLLTCPADLLLEAPGPTGAVADFAASATDAVTLSPELTYSQAPGTRFGLGDTQVTARARDAAGLSSTCGFHVRVRDTTPPTLSCPARVTAEATSSTGALVTYAPASASDTVSAVALTYGQASGSRFAVGTTPVRVWARDVAGNTSTCDFEVEVRDTTAPVLTCPPGPVAEALSAQGAPVDFAVSATDAVTATGLVLTYSQAPGGVFALGTTRVDVSARDAAGNTGTCSFPVTVRDTTAPVLVCPVAVVREATSARGAEVSFLPGATDAVTHVPEVTSSPASGSTFPLGDTPVTASARDAAGNTGTCSFAVTVRDTTSPTLVCPANQVLDATQAEGAQAFFSARVSDAVSARLVPTFSRAPGSLFPVGTTRVSASVTDRAGNQASCGFSITVRAAHASR